MAAKSKSKKRARRIVARSITLKDAQGRPRIVLDAGSGKSPATICVLSEHGRSIEIQAMPDGALCISLRGRRTVAALGMTPKEDAGLDIRDRDGRPGTILGATFDSGEHHLTIFRNGKVRLTTSMSSIKKISD
jgi:hypothetical protein